MLKANCRIKLNEYTEIPKAGITPAEAVVLKEIHGKNAGGEVFSNVVVVSDDPSSTHEEINRLSASYGRDLVSKLFPGAVPQLPQSFEEVGIRAEVAIAPEPEPSEEQSEEPEDQEPEPVPVRRGRRQKDAEQPDAEQPE